MCNAILYALLAGVCLSAHLLRGVGSLPVPTTTASPSISPAVSSDTDESTAEASPEVSSQAVVASTSRQDNDGSSFTSRMYTVVAIFKEPTSSPETDESTDDPIDPNLPLSSAVVSSSTASLSEESCSSGVVQPGPCRKRSASTERLSEMVLDSYMPGTKRSLRKANPSSPNWAHPNLEEAPGTNETSSDSANNHTSRQSSQSRDSDSPSSPQSSNKEAASASKSSSDSSSTNSQPGTPM